ncbi:DNA-binding response regulator, NarL/FixJ family, contains REC and HTH domains [Daejeonella rubra]|uniref:DNA-binding response regulator, NarL/FixJ family, contains REC and HTH domains n=1 Tax=Daejeonella rubra TaxID=990371 RepID=A0A1G9VL47_9SPHI|nr:response regulator transcription factor [Daejeonella rubra]SDM72914.1 DNA-binding response regulator, NarL/FixJ family, contains REC and HTH domains [Daejeonella rubra]
MPKLIIADDHQLLIEGLISILSEVKDLEILNPVNNGNQLINSLILNPADIVLLDLNMPKLDGIKTLAILRRDFPDLKVIILTNYDQPQLIEEVKKLGAHGYLLKNSPSFILKDAIAKVNQGEFYFEDRVLPEKDNSPYFIDDFMKKYQLTKREVEIIKMIAKELTSKEIGDSLFISEFTVSTHRRNIMKKLNSKNVAGLLKFARQHGLADA